LLDVRAWVGSLTKRHEKPPLRRRVSPPVPTHPYGKPRRDRRHGPLTREEPRDRLEPHDLRTEGQALVDGVAGATWGLTARALTVRPYRPLDRAEITALRRGTADVLRDL